MLYCDEYLTPASLDEAFGAMAAHRGRCRIVAGATDTLPWAREGRAGDVAIPVLIDVTRIPELIERRVDGGRVRLGAATPVQRLLDDATLARAMPCMPRCAVWFADDQIRESATIGGNLVNASPAADLTPPLLAHNAVVELAARRDGKSTRRRLPLAEFVRGPGKTALADDEILLAIECEALDGHGGSFEKVGHRRSLVIATVCLAAVVKLDRNGRTFEDVRIAIGGIGPVPSRLVDVERVLAGEAVTRDTVERAAEIPADLIQSRSRREYRRDVTRGFIARGILNAVRRADPAAAARLPDLEASYA